MKRKRKGMNKHQKAMFQPGEQRLRRDEIEEFLVLSQSDDAGERLEAAEHLCPCHVRTQIDDVQRAVLRMMEDEDVHACAAAAWHTLEDGGVPDTPALDGIFTRAVERLDEEPSKMTRRFIEMFAVPHVRGKAEIEFQRAQRSEFGQRDKCDFCGESDVTVKTDYETEIGAGDARRLALICEACA